MRENKFLFQFPFPPHPLLLLFWSKEAFLKSFPLNVARSRFYAGMVLCALLVLGMHLTGYAQKSKQQLEREKKQNLKKIAETNQILKETSDQKQVSIGQLSALKQQIASRTQVIQSISGEVNILDQEVRELSGIASSMEQDMNKLKKEYASMVYAAAKATTSYNKLLFLFSASTFTQLIMRFQYLKQYSQSRKNQVKQVEKIRITLNTQREKLRIKKQEKQQLLNVQIAENHSLEGLKYKQNEVVTQLNQRESQLREDLAESERAVNQLEKLITDIVEEEIRKAAEVRRVAREKAREEATPAQESAEKTAIALNKEDAALASSFAGSKSKMLWPVKSGFISSKFGRHEHSVLKGVYVDNLGVRIQTNKGEAVRVVYDGVVTSVEAISGLNLMVVVQHGDYFTIYANLRKAQVKANQKLKAKDVIGEVYTDKDGVSELQFQIWKNYDRLNPEAWLYDK